MECTETESAEERLSNRGGGGNTPLPGLVILEPRLRG